MGPMGQTGDIESFGSQPLRRRGELTRHRGVEDVLEVDARGDQARLRRHHALYRLGSFDLCARDVVGAHELRLGPGPNVVEARIGPLEPPLGRLEHALPGNHREERACRVEAQLSSRVDRIPTRGLCTVLCCRVRRIRGRGDQRLRHRERPVRRIRAHGRPTVLLFAPRTQGLGRTERDRGEEACAGSAHAGLGGLDRELGDSAAFVAGEGEAHDLRQRQGILFRLRLDCSGCSSGSLRS